MHPDISRRLAAQRREELTHLMEMTRMTAAARRAGLGRWIGPAGEVPPAGVGAPRHGRELAPVPPPTLGPQLPGTLPGMFADGLEAFGVRAYLTPDEARQLVAEGSGLFARFADRLDDPRRRPAGAKPFEVVVLGRRLRDPV